MKIDSDDFELFGIEPRFAQDASVLERRWRELQTQVHPDRFAAQGASAQRVAMQWAVRVNEAFQRLKDPLSRAAYLCELNGAAIEAQRNTSMPSSFLAQQMEWREALEAARSVEQVESLRDRMTAYRRAVFPLVEEAIDIAHDYARAAQQVRALMFVERFAHDVDQRLEALGQ